MVYIFPSASLRTSWCTNLSISPCPTVRCRTYSPFRFTSTISSPPDEGTFPGPIMHNTVRSAVQDDTFTAFEKDSYHTISPHPLRITAAPGSVRIWVRKYLDCISLLIESTNVSKVKYGVV